MNYAAALYSRPGVERLIVLLYIVLSSLTLAHSSYVAYEAYFAYIHSSEGGETLQDRYRLHNTTALSPDHPLFYGKDHAPDQYRVGVMFPVKFVADKLAIRKYYQLVVVVDFAACIATCFALYVLLISSGFFTGLSSSSQRLAVALLLASFTFPLAWVVPWLRPETLPTSLYLACSLLMLGSIRSASIMPNTLFLALATAYQGFIRADVPACLGLAIMLFSVTRAGRAHFASRRAGLSIGVLVIVIAGGVQMLLKYVLFPHATYPPDSEVVQLLRNFNARDGIPFVIALLPYVVLGAFAQRTRVWRRLDPLDLLTFIAAGLYLPLWLTVGVAAEVRIFVPYMLLLTPTATKLLLLLFTGKAAADETFQQDPASCLTER